MGYVESLIGEDERVHYVARHHWTIFAVRTWFLGVLLLLGIVASVALNMYGNDLISQLKLDQNNELLFRVVVSAVLVIYPIVSIVIGFIRWRSDQFLVTNFRVIHVSGILSKSVIDSSLEKVNDVTLFQSLIGRVLNYGTIEIITGSDIGVNKLNRIARPLDFKMAMLNAKQELEGPERASAASLPMLLTQLADLRDRGVLTDQEYLTKKSQLLEEGKL